VPKTPDTTFQTDELPEDRTLLFVDDDAVFLERISRAMAERGFEVRSSTTAAKALALISEAPPAFAVVDLRLADGSGLDLIAALRDARPNSRVIMLTGYGSARCACLAAGASVVSRSCPMAAHSVGVSDLQQQRL
jgi:two-component system, response regulator RegA